jgi:hypothetical protein
MRFLRSSLSLLIGIGSVSALGCGGATEPSLAMSYDLVSYEGQALPVETGTVVEVSTQPGGPSSLCGDRLTGMHLQFVTGSSFTQTESRLLVCDDGRPDAPSSIVTNGTYQASGATLELDVDLGGGFSQHALARMSGDALVVYRREISNGAGLSVVTQAPLGFVATR